MTLLSDSDLQLSLRQSVDLWRSQILTLFLFCFSHCWIFDWQFKFWTESVHFLHDFWQMNKFDCFRNIFEYDVFLSFVESNITSRSNHRLALYLINFRRCFSRLFDIDTFLSCSHFDVKFTRFCAKIRLQSSDISSWQTHYQQNCCVKKIKMSHSYKTCYRNYLFLNVRSSSSLSSCSRWRYVLSKTMRFSSLIFELF